MALGFRKARAFILLLSGLLALAINHTLDGFSVVFAISLLISSTLTLIYVFLNFDTTINQKIVMEMMVDGFSGLVIFTYPESNQNFFLIVFSFWIVFMGILITTSGLMEEKNKKFLWAYALVGIVSIMLGFVVLNYDQAYMSSVLYLVGFTLLIYSGMSLYIFLKRKADIY